MQRRRPRPEPCPLAPGQVRSLSGPADSSLVVVVAVHGERSQVTLVTSYPEFASQQDLVLPAGSAASYPLVVHCDLTAPVWSHQLGPVVAVVEDFVVRAAKRFNPEGAPWGTWVGPRLTGPFDARWQFKQACHRQLLALAADCVAAALFDGECDTLVRSTRPCTECVEREHGTVEAMDTVMPSARNVDLNAVRDFVYAAHADQVDKAGAPYVGHLERTAARARDLAGFYGVDADDAEATGLLHDVLEDTAATRVELEEFVPARIVDAVVALTHPRGEPAEVYFTRVRSNALARTVKNADIDDNADPSRLELLESADRDRLATKYAVRRALLAAGSGGVPTISPSKGSPVERA
jgi:hypothetical protein